MGRDRSAWEVTVELCEQMREWHEAGHTQREIADEFGPEHGTVWYHVTGKCKHDGQVDDTGCATHPNRVSEGHARLDAMDEPRPGEHVLDTIERGLQTLNGGEDGGGESA